MATPDLDSLIELQAKLAKERERSKQEATKLEQSQAELLKLHEQLQAQVKAAAVQEESKAEKCCANFKKALPIVTGVVGALSGMAQLGLNTASQINGDPTLAQASTILAESTTTLMQLSTEVQNAKKANEYIKAAANATKDALKIAASQTGNTSLETIGNTVVTATAGLDKITNVQDALSFLNANTSRSLQQASELTGNQRLVELSQRLTKKDETL